MGKFDKRLANRLAVPKVYDETAQTPVTHGAQVLQFYDYQGRNVLYDDKRVHTSLLRQYYDVLKSREGKWRIQDFSCAALACGNRLSPTLPTIKYQAYGL